MFSQELIQAIAEQIGVIYQAQSATQAMRIWTRSQNWEGSHKWFGRRFKDLESDSREILEFVAEYVKVVPTIPGTDAVLCSASDLKGTYATFLDWALKIKDGYVGVQAMATAEDQTDAATWFDHLVEDVIDRIESLNTDMAELTRAGTDQAALLIFDKRKK
jgi:ferritin